jgi:hypothetical protein
MPSGQHRIRLMRLLIIGAFAAATNIALFARAAVAVPPATVKVDTDNVCLGPQSGSREDNLILSANQLFVWLNSPTSTEGHTYSYTIYDQGVAVVSAGLSFESAGCEGTPWLWGVVTVYPTYTAMFTLVVYDESTNVIGDDRFRFIDVG